MAAINQAMGKSACPRAGDPLVPLYDDGAGWPSATVEKEQAFRRGFMEEARRMVGEWIAPDDATFDPWGQERAAQRLRRRLRERCTLYADSPDGTPGAARHLGYRPGHVVPAAYLRGRHHALVYILEAWDGYQDKTYDDMILSAWLKTLERWAAEQMQPESPVPPPRPLLPIVTAPADAKAQSASPILRTVRSIDVSPPGNGPAAPPRPLPLTRVDQIEMRPPEWLLRGILERDSFIELFGDPACGKSFLAIDWACRVATGTPWRGHPVKPGPVVYIAGEGQHGFGRRIRAWAKHNGVNLAGVPMYIAPAVAIPDTKELVRLVLALKSLPTPPALIVLDTLARCFGGGDENSTQDMSKFVAACDLLRQYYHCTILVVHHTGHADKNRARGAIALKAALDAEYRLAKDGNLLLTATKMKDAEMPAPVAMELVTVELPSIVDEYGNPVTSAAIDVMDADVSAIVSKAKAIRPRGKWQDVGFTVAHRLIAASENGQVSIDAWRDGCQAAGMVRQNQHRVLEGLVSRGDLAVRDGALSIVTT